MYLFYFFKYMAEQILEVLRDSFLDRMANAAEYFDQICLVFVSEVVQHTSVLHQDKQSFGKARTFKRMDTLSTHTR